MANAPMRAPTIEGVAIAIVAALRGAARAHYQAMVLSWGAVQVVQGEKQLKVPPLDTRRGFMHTAYDEITRFLDDDHAGAFKQALIDIRKMDIAAIKENPSGDEPPTPHLKLVR